MSSLNDEAARIGARITECMAAVFGDRFDPSTLLVEVEDDGCALASWEGVYIDRDDFGKWGFGRLLHIPGNREIPDETECEECGACSTFDLALTQAAGLYAEHLLARHLLEGL